MAAIDIQDINKSYQDVKALQSIDFEVEAGQLFGLIGPDGAGKTTLFRILTTLLLPDSGTARVQGYDTVKDYKKIRRIIGYMPGKFSLYQDLSVEENLRFFATIFGTSIEATYHLIEDIYVQIEPFRKRRAGKLSGGMKQKLALCCALIHEPEVLFLDEPTTGVDAVSRAEFWEMLKRLKKKGITIMVSTPYMDEAALCERIALIQEGNILSIDSPEKMVGQYDRPLYAIKSKDMYPLLTTLKAKSFTHSVEPFGEFLHLSLKEGVSLESVRHALWDEGLSEVEIEVTDPTIEDIFLALS